MGQREADKLESSLETEAPADYVTFLLSGYRCAIVAHRVWEIQAHPQVFPLIHSAPFVKGLAHFRGEVIPVWDLALRYRWPTQRLDRFSVVIVVGVVTRLTGLWVESLGEEMQAIAATDFLDVTRDHPLAPLSRYFVKDPEGGEIYVLDEDLLMVS